jgi:glucose/arabinose dehydrogenase/mono/diheme cytochrome c family protein
MLIGFLYSCNGNELPSADADNGGLILPGGFQALVVVDSIIGNAREITVSSDGDLYVKTQRPIEGNVAAVRDHNGDGKADSVTYFAQVENEIISSLQAGVEIYKGYLYFSTALTVYRMKLKPGSLIPEGEMEVIVRDDHAHGSHEHVAKPFSFDNRGNLYVPFGAPSNACQEPKRTPGVPGMDPCPQLEDHGGIWKFDAEKPNQTQKDGERYATGIRSIVAMDWNPIDDELYAVIHGRDDLFRLFPELFDSWQSALLPSEEFVRVTEGADFGWPYCYYDQLVSKKVLAPEYGGDGVQVDRCADFDDPVIGFPGHWAPNGIYFYTGDQFPERYKNGAFIAFHGSTNRAPYPQSGYFIAFVPFQNGRATGAWEVFADGFAQVDPIVSVNDAVYRPMGIAMGPDGSLYVSETNQGKIWRVMFTGDKKLFGKPQLDEMESRKSLVHIRDPHRENDNIQEEFTGKGQEIYNWYCGACHQQDGKGDSGRFPPLAGTDWVTGDERRLINVVLNGLEGPVQVNGETYDNLMPQHSFLSDEQISDVLTFIRSNFGNDAPPITPEQVTEVRASSGG